MMKKIFGALFALLLFANVCSAEMLTIKNRKTYREYITTNILSNLEDSYKKEGYKNKAVVRFLVLGNNLVPDSINISTENDDGYKQALADAIEKSFPLTNSAPQRVSMGKIQPYQYGNYYNLEEKSKSDQKQYVKQYKKYIKEFIEAFLKDLPETDSFKIEPIRATLIIGKDGKVQECRFMGSSGDEKYDREMHKAIMQKNLPVNPNIMDWEDDMFYAYLHKGTKEFYKNYQSYSKDVYKTFYMYVPMEKYITGVTKTYHTLITVDKNGKAKNVEVIYSLAKPENIERLIKNLSKLQYPKFPKCMDIDEITLYYNIDRQAVYDPASYDGVRFINALLLGTLLAR